jgi:Zn-dependent protease/predicted transcriptional regulator
MLKASIKLFKIFGIEIRLDYSWFIIFSLLIYYFGFSYFPALLPNLNKGLILVITIITVLLFFFSILFHEVSHSLVAKSKGIKVSRISLFIFGGMSEIEKEPDKPSTEFLMSIAGPIASFVLSGVFAILWFFTRNIPAISIPAGYLTVINLVLGIFNLLPGYPLDGGRVLRSIIWKVTNNPKKATFIASTVGRIIGFLMIAVGIYFIFTNNFLNGIWLVFIGWFLQSSAYLSYRQLIFDSSIKGFKVKDMMNTNIVAIKRDATVGEIVSDYFMKYKFGIFPVLDNHDNKKLIGLISIHDIKSVPREQWDSTNAMDIAEEVKENETIDSEAEANEALRQMSKYNLNHLVILSDKKLKGMITKSDILQFIQLYTELH